MVQQAYLTAVSDLVAVKKINQSFVEKTIQWRKKQSKKHFGEAHVLTVEEALKTIHEREEHEQTEEAAKERRRLLRGQVGFAKKMWKEGFNMDFDLFE